MNWIAFYARFDTQDFSKEQNELNATLRAKQDPEIIISLEDVDKALSKIKVRKASGPDKICGLLLNLVVNSLAPIFNHFPTVR